MSFVYQSFPASMFLRARVISRTHSSYYLVKLSRFLWICYFSLIIFWIYDSRSIFEWLTTRSPLPSLSSSLLTKLSSLLLCSLSLDISSRRLKICYILEFRLLLSRCKFLLTALVFTSLSFVLLVSICSSFNYLDSLSFSSLLVSKSFYNVLFCMSTSSLIKVYSSTTWFYFWTFVSWLERSSLSCLTLWSSRLTWLSLLCICSLSTSIA